MTIWSKSKRDQKLDDDGPDHRTAVARRHPVSILYKSIAGRYRPVKVADGPITARYGFIKNASWAVF